MSQKSFSLKYGKGELAFSLPSEQVACEVLGREYPPIEDVSSAIRQALAHPIDSPPLRELVRPGETVVITVSDITRAWQNMDQVLPLLLDELNLAGVPDENITVLIVVGGHRQNTASEFVTLCGETVCHRVRVLNHDAWDEANMVYLGKTSRGTEVSVNRLVAEADRVILTGGIIYHYMVGYGGGRKSILPGCSSIKTIRQNHLWALASGGAAGSNPNAFSGRTEGNECHEDMMEIAAFVKPDFILNVVPTPKGDFAGIFAGNWVSAWQKGTKLVDEIYGVDIPEKGDIVITTAGGFPKDINLYQTGKTMDNAYYAVKRGGVVILLSECPDIYEPPEFSDWFKYGSRQEMEAALRKNFGIPGWVVLKEMECGDIATFVMVTLPQNAELVKKANMIPVSTIEEALAIAKERCASDAPRYIVMPQGANTVPLLDGKVSVG
ncbi:MAG: nickel-dependent lactate racemase [Anaeromusa sp.]|uniref:nickel-dependent lactate racemase n=1 Tax=Anaeromusa sp. TaxID=1872520 RepID=UPI00261E3283|nr:nickel-dependent lactate racemase [Anaeromusa sp.]MDD3158932.1 nickel-dependent lactate racemase [Anaeromusa sp.]MEA4834655.1 nickel-dependent lactate racemase [Anaeromusa sp.]